MPKNRKLTLLSILVFVFALAVTNPVSFARKAVGQDPVQTASTANELRFPVAHMHVGTWCMGYLYISNDGLRYEVVRPDKDKPHSVQLKRSDLKAVQLWNLFGQVQNIAEIKTAHANYHFYLLQSDADLAPGRRWNVASAAPATTLVSVILNPAGALPSNPGGVGATASGPQAVAPAVPASIPPADAAAPATQPPPPQAVSVQPAAVVSANTPPTTLPDPAPAASSNTLDGFYAGMTIDRGRVHTRYLLFTRDGWVFRDFPEDGMEGFDATAFRSKPDRNKSWTGRYRLDGNQISILWQDYADNREILQRNENAASAGPDVYVPICRCDQKKLSGTYIWGLPASGQYIQFSPDGIFLDHGTTDQLFVPSPFYDRPRILRGSYTIQNQTLTLNFQDGRLKKKTFLAPKAQENQPTFDWIGLGIQRLYEQNYQPSP